MNVILVIKVYALGCVNIYRIRSIVYAKTVIIVIGFLYIPSN